MPGGTTKRGMSPRPTAIDLFCGVGGMSLGFEQAGFDVLAAFDCEQRHVDTYHGNFPHAKAVCADLSALSGDEVRAQAGLGDRHIDVVFGGPPCQGFSFIGQRKRNDPRSELLLHFARLVGEIKPSYFVVENVSGVLKDWSAKWLQGFKKKARQAGYELSEAMLLNAADFGVPQNRRRVFIIGAHKGLALPQCPEPLTTGNGNAGALLLRPVVSDAISDLPDIDDYGHLLTSNGIELKSKAAADYAQYLRGEKRDPTDLSRKRRKSLRLSGCLRTEHTDETRRRFRSTQQGEYEPVSRLYRLRWDGLAPTIRAGTDSSRGSFMAARPIHPEHDRCISVREAARLHSFPDWFQFHGTKWHGFRQIGNSVPPLLARGAAQRIVEALCEGHAEERHEDTATASL